MNLGTLIEQYVSYRRALGERFVTNASTLRAFGRAVGPRADVADVRPEQAAAFLAGTGPLTAAWHVRYSALRGLYEYAIPRGHAAGSPLPAVRPKRPPAFVPHIYSRDELRRLLAATEHVRHKLRRTDPATLRTLLLLLYATGLRVGEARNLAVADVDLDRSVATVRGGKFYTSRLVPLGRQLVGALAAYSASRRRARCGGGDQPRLFVGGDGRPLSKPGLDAAFRLARSRAAIGRTDGARYQPRMHDLRHTFAVHRLTEWYRQGRDVQALLPQLSVYLGHRNLSGTQVYLTTTPELLRHAAARFDGYARGEQNHA